MSDTPKRSPSPPDPHAIKCMDCDGVGSRNGLPCFHCAATGKVCSDCYLPTHELGFSLRCSCVHA